MLLSFAQSPVEACTNSAECDRSLPDLGQHRAGFDRSWAISTGSSLIVGPHLGMLLEQRNAVSPMGLDLHSLGTALTKLTTG